jgi:hypothetical protein
MTLAPTSTNQTIETRSSARAGWRVRTGFASLSLSLAGWVGWISWRITHLELHPIPLVVLVLEIAGVAIGVIVALALALTGEHRSYLADLHAADCHVVARRYAFAVADIVGRTRAEDLHHDVRTVVRAARRSMRRQRADYAMAAVVIDGPRRLGIVVFAIAGLLVGVAPFPVPPAPAIVAAAVGLLCMSLAHTLLSERRIRVGDRMRWTYSTLGEVVAREDLVGVAPRSWVGTVATIVLVNVAVALRGMSDRWTHGLPHMGDDERMVAMLFALGLVVGALYTMATTEPPEVDNAHLAPRRLEERTARQSVLGATVCVGLVGLLAGILPGSVDPADDDPGRVEHVVQVDAVEGIVRE